MIKAETYLALEDSLSKKLQGEFKKLVGVLFRQVQELINQGKYDEASELVQKFSLQDMIQEVGPYIEYITNLSMLFGASRVTRKPGTSVVGLGFEKDTMYQAMQLFKQMISANADEYLKKQAVQLIANYKLEATPVQDGAQVVQKDDPLHDFESFMDDAGRSFFNLTSSLHTSRMSAYGFTAEADALGLVEYQINEQLDARTCPICRKMHGKVFKVAEARRLLDMVIRSTDPDDLKSLQPWPKQDKETIASLDTLTPEQLVTRGWHIPPFHPRCRGLLARVGKVPSIDQINSGNTDQREYANLADFKVLGMNVTDKQVSKWNSLVSATPDALLSALLNTNDIDLLKSIFNKTTKVKVSMYEKYILMKASGSYYGFEKMMTELKIAEDAVSVSTPVVFNSKESFMDYVKSSYVAAQEANVGELHVPRNSASFDLSDKGFTIVGKEWVLNMESPDSMAKFLS